MVLKIDSVSLNWGNKKLLERDGRQSIFKISQFQFLAHLQLPTSPTFQVEFKRRKFTNYYVWHLIISLNLISLPPLFIFYISQACETYFCRCDCVEWLACVFNIYENWLSCCFNLRISLYRSCLHCIIGYFCLQLTWFYGKASGNSEAVCDKEFVLFEKIEKILENENLKWPLILKYII